MGFCLYSSPLIFSLFRLGSGPRNNNFRNNQSLTVFIGRYAAVHVPVLSTLFATFFYYFSVRTQVTFYFITTMNVLLENVIVLEARENCYINFHSRLIISTSIVWLVREVQGSEEGKTEQKGGMCPHLLANLWGHCIFLSCYQYVPLTI